MSSLAECFPQGNLSLEPEAVASTLGPEFHIKTQYSTATVQGQRYSYYLGYSWPSSYYFIDGHIKSNMMEPNSTTVSSAPRFQSYNESNIGTRIEALGTVEATVALAFVVLRVWAQAIVVQWLSWDDHLMVVSTVRAIRPA